MLTQFFRNKIQSSWKLNNVFKNLEDVILQNINKKETEIIKEIVDAWKANSTINLSTIQINNVDYDLWAHFHVVSTHGKKITVTDEVEINSEMMKYPTEYGDIAIIVEYLMEKTLVNRKLSILQTKKEKRSNSVDIPLHQLYLMHYWPPVTVSGKKFVFNNLTSDDFSFYHFILNHSHTVGWCTTLCSAVYVSMNLNVDKLSLNNEIMAWLLQKKVNPKANPPQKVLKMNLSPKTSNGSEWRLSPKPFRRFLKEAAYLFFGTNDQNVIALSSEKIPNILHLTVSATRSERERNISRVNYEE